MSCTHRHAALVATGAFLCIRGESQPGNVRWCSQCGALRCEYGGSVGEWMLPGIDSIVVASIKALRAETERRAQEQADA